MGGDEKFDEFLLSNNISKDFFKENMRKEILVDKHKENIIKDINISEEDAKKFYEENKDNLILIRASHILVSSEEEGKKILERLKDGEDFATLATLESLDSVSAAQGGDLGYFRKGQMISEFEDAAFSLEIGETSDLIKTEVGYHIIHLEDRKETYEDLKQDIVDMLKEQEYIEKIRELRNKAKVKTI
jgi:parvulin-like peptidyl-prolyl isomerase